MQRNRHNVILRVIAFLILIVYPIAHYPFWVNDLSHPGDFFAYDVMREFVPCIALSMLLFVYTLKKPVLFYIALHLFFLLVSLSMWYNQFGLMSTNTLKFITSPEQFSAWLVVPIITSLLLLIFYKPIVRFFNAQWD